MAEVFTGRSRTLLRKAVGKKDADLIRQELRPVYRAGDGRSVIRKKLVDDLAGQMETFGRYGFPKAHSVAYSIISYQTAWLKVHHPAEYMAALLSSEIGNTDNVVKYINEARELGLKPVMPPDVVESGFKFTVVGDRRIRFGLGAVRHVEGRRDRGRSSPRAAAARSARSRILSKRMRPPEALQQARSRRSLIAAGACLTRSGTPAPS